MLSAGQGFAEGLNELLLVRLTTGRCGSCPPFIDEENGAQRSGETSWRDMPGWAASGPLPLTMTLWYLPPNEDLFLKRAFIALF